MDPSVIGSVFNLSDKPFTVVGITPPGFFGDTLRASPPDFFLPLNMEPYVESEADLNKYGQHWLQLIGRVAPGARPAAMEAAMRVELKQWLRSHWGEMSAADRAKFPEQTLFLAPGGAGIASMRVVSSPRGASVSSTMDALPGRRYSPPCPSPWARRSIA